MNKKVLIVINTGTPDAPEPGAVRRFLSEFLNDRRVIDLPWLIRKVLVNIVIVPFRSPVSTFKYRALWTVKGSPLLVNLNNLVSKLSTRLKDDYIVFGAMRYGNPSLRKVLEEARTLSPGRIIIFPLYPHYASSTTGSVYENVSDLIKRWEIIPEVILAGQFYSHPSFLESVADQVRKYDFSGYDHILFSYHGLPERQIKKVHPEIDFKACNCVTEFPPHGSFCYRATCYETTRLLAGKLALSSGSYSTSFQSRLTNRWLAPFTDNVLRELAYGGKKKVLVVAPSFASDCLETLQEIGEEYGLLFRSAGGNQLDLVRSLNDEDRWVEAIVEIAGLQ